MNANPILLQKKYARVIEAFAQKAGLTLDNALTTSIIQKSTAWSEKACLICTV